MHKGPFFIQFILLSCVIHAQFDFEVVRVSGINTKADEIACTIREGNLVFVSNARQDLVSDYRWLENRTFTLKIAEREKTFAGYSSVEHLFETLKPGDEGTACYNPADSTLYFSSANEYGKPGYGNLRIFFSKWNGDTWSTPVPLPFCRGRSNFAHPWYDEKNNLIVFSSDQPGGFGGMDIWFSYRSADGWTDPACLDFLVNSPGNEVFPTVFEGDIYYASNGLNGYGGYDIHCALARQQWKTSVQLPSPVNTEGDDINMFFLNSDKGFLTSNRMGGAGGDDVYLFNVLQENNSHNYTAQLICNGLPVAQSAVAVSNDLLETVLEGLTGTDGKFSLSSLSLSRKYRMRVSGIDPSQYQSTLLLVYDEDGKKIMEFRMNAEGTFEFELLPFDRIAGLSRPALTDRSILEISFEAQVYNEQPGDIGSNELITIVDSRGEIVALAYTQETGRFTVKDASPEAQYTFKLAANSKAGNIVVFDRGQELTLPVLSEEAHYQRISENDKISLVNELNETIYISQEDVFVVNRIYYHYNSSELSPQSREQLNQLLVILKKNPGLNVELYSHTDALGSEEYNLQLSKRRADATARYLMAHGIAGSRISAIGMGEKQLLYACPDDYSCSDEARAINRRTEIKLVKVY